MAGKERTEGIGKTAIARDIEAEKKKRSRGS